MSANLSIRPSHPPPLRKKENIKYKYNTPPSTSIVFHRLIHSWHHHAPFYFNTDIHDICDKRKKEIGSAPSPWVRLHARVRWSLFSAITRATTSKEHHRIFFGITCSLFESAGGPASRRNNLRSDLTSLLSHGPNSRCMCSNRIPRPRSTHSHQSGTHYILTQRRQACLGLSSWFTLTLLLKSLRFKQSATDNLMIKAWATTDYITLRGLTEMC